MFLASATASAHEDATGRGITACAIGTRARAPDTWSTGRPWLRGPRASFHDAARVEDAKRLNALELLDLFRPAPQSPGQGCKRTYTVGEIPYARLVAKTPTC